jgi:UDP:flavonoid glycosyltransferase YjiC (YdhE family)
MAAEVPARKRILFVSESVTLAQIVRLATLARALDPSRYDIHFAATAFPPQVAFPVQRWPLWGISAATAQSRLAAGKRLYTPAVLRQYVEADLGVIDGVRPDLIVGDLRWSLAVSAPVRKVPLASLINAYWSPHARRDGFPMPDHPVVRWLGERTASKYFPRALPYVFRYFAAPLDRERRRAGLAPLGDLLGVLSFGDFILYADPPEMVAMRELPPNHHFLGAIPWSAAGQLPEAWGRAGTPVYVTMGSSGAEACVPIVLRALSRLPVDVLLATAGRSLPDRLPDNVRAVPFVDGGAACARASVVVHNGGSSTGYQSLLAGTPVLGIPNNLDQYLASERIGALGAGLMLRSGSLTEDAVVTAVQRLLVEPQFRESAEGLRQAFSHHDAGANFRDFVGRSI